MCTERISGGNVPNRGAFQMEVARPRVGNRLFAENGHGAEPWGDARGVDDSVSLFLLGRLLMTRFGAIEPISLPSTRIREGCLATVILSAIAL